MEKTKAGHDIINLILEDHKALKKLIRVMKDTDETLEDRKNAFKEFGPLLVKHTKPEEQILYTRMKDDDDMREEGMEGDVEHGLADQMLEEAKRTDDEDLWSARVKVLAELVKHHVEEEEKELFPLFRKHSEREERVEMGQLYLEAQENIKSDGQEKDPSKNVENVSHTSI
jgi:hemerythrin superfamily protein